MESNVRRLAVWRVALVCIMVLGATGYRAREASAQQPSDMTAEALLGEILSDLGGRQLALTKLTVPPGAGSMEHRHQASGCTCSPVRSNPPSMVMHRPRTGRATSGSKRTVWDQNIIDPVLVGEDTVVITGFRARTMGFHLQRSATGWSTEDLWATAETAQFMTNPVRLDDTTVFGMTSRNRGQYFVPDLETGEVLWTSAPRQAQHAAMLRAGGTLLILEDDGELIVGRADRQHGLEELRRYTVANSPTWTWAAPAVSGRRIFIKDLTGVSLWTWDWSPERIAPR